MRFLGSSLYLFFFSFPPLKWITSSGMVSDSFCGGTQERLSLGDVCVARICWEIPVGTSVIWTDSEVKWTCIF